MKRIVAFMLTLTLLLGAALPAAAADTSADERLKAVTLKVKETLGLDTSAYDSFYGEVSENELTPVWSLNWSGEGGSVYVEADEDGTVRSYYWNDNTDQWGKNDAVPSLPAGAWEEARKAADQFMNKILANGESVRYNSDEDTTTLRTSQYYFSGTILLNNLPSPLSFSISVRAKDNTITHFYRDTLSGYIGKVPSAVPAATEAQAKELLRTTLSLRLEYVLSGDSKTAVLRYLPDPTDEFYVDAQTGKLVNLTDLYNEVENGGSGNNSGRGATSGATADSEKGILTDAEEEGAAKLAGALDKKTLDTKLQAITALGLKNYTLASVTYAVDREDGTVSCCLQYAKKTDDGIWRRYVTVDAKTGTMVSVSSSAPWSEKLSKTVDLTAAQSAAESFLKAYYGGEFADTALYGSQNAADNGYSVSHSFQYAQKVNGYFYAGNYLNIGIDATDGSVSDFSRNFDRTVTFDSADGMISAAAALDAWLGTYSVSLRYIAVPEKLDLSAPEWKPYIESGYSYLYTLKLGYGLDREDSYSGVDAKSGEAVKSENESESNGIAYSDISGSWVKGPAETLAKYGVGWLGGAMKPGAVLTQFDLLCLLVSTQGYLYDPASGDENQKNTVYQYAYSMGLITRSQRDDDLVITRGELVKCILTAGGYGNAAKLKGIWRCDFADGAAIPEEYLSYAALAQGLGLASGVDGGNFAAGRTATRAEGLMMLYRFMDQ